MNRNLNMTVTAANGLAIGMNKTGGFALHVMGVPCLKDTGMMAQIMEVCLLMLT
tara:strand:+ start:455 stop:616 length:162 start_codon:yes stop_codon:yes gene_type:complete